jgi:hypothetical protein
VQSSWAEKRQDLFDAVAALPETLRAEARRRVDTLQPREPDISAMSPFRAGDAIETKHFDVALDAKTGAISQLRSRESARDCASARQPLAAFSYQTLSKADYDRFFEAYLKSKADWAPKDFGKPNIERFGAGSRVWEPSLVECHAGRSSSGHRIVAQLRIDDAEEEKSGRAAWPRKMYLEILLPDAQPVAEISFSWFGKAASRMPEALWLSFTPPFRDERGWMMEKSGSPVSPFDVVTGGNRAMHAALGGLHYNGPEGALRIESLDAPVVALGEKSPVNFTRSQPDLAKGFHFSLFNNGWGTNYIQWFGEDMRFRFRISA